MHTLEVPNNPVFIKTSTAVIGGAAMTFAAFAFMQYLISGEQRAPVKPGGDIIVEIFQAPEDSKVRHIQKIQPPPPMPKVPQKAPPLDTIARGCSWVFRVYAHYGCCIPCWAINGIVNVATKIVNCNWRKVANCQHRIG